MEKNVIEMASNESVVVCMCETLKQIKLIEKSIKFIDENETTAYFIHEIKDCKYIIIIDSDIPSDLVVVNLLSVVYAHGMQLSINGTTYYSYYGALNGIMECE